MCYAFYVNDIPSCVIELDTAIRLDELALFHLNAIFESNAKYCLYRSNVVGFRRVRTPTLFTQPYCCWHYFNKKQKKKKHQADGELQHVHSTKIHCRKNNLLDHSADWRKPFTLLTAFCSPRHPKLRIFRMSPSFDDVTTLVPHEMPHPVPEMCEVHL